MGTPADSARQEMNRRGIRPAANPGGKCWSRQGQSGLVASQVGSWSHRGVFVYSGHCFRRAVRLGSITRARWITKGYREGYMELVLARSGEPARLRALRSLGLCVVLLLAGPGHLAAQDGTLRLIPASAVDDWPAPSETASSTRTYPIDPLLPDDSRDHTSWIGSGGLVTDAPLTLGPDPQRPAGTTFTPTDAHSLWAVKLPSWTASCPPDRLLSDESNVCDRRMASAALTMDDGQAPEQAETQIPRWEFLERHRLLFSILIPVTTVV